MVLITARISGQHTCCRRYCHYLSRQHTFRGEKLPDFPASTHRKREKRLCLQVTLFTASAGIRFSRSGVTDPQQYAVFRKQRNRATDNATARSLKSGFATAASSLSVALRRCQKAIQRLSALSRYTLTLLITTAMK